MSIHALVTGRLKAKPNEKWQVKATVKTHYTATMIANDDANRSQKIHLFTDNDSIGIAMKNLRDGQSFSASGELKIINHELHLRARTFQALADDSPTPREASRNATETTA
jgi:hypothetical protein